MLTEMGCHQMFESAVVKTSQQFGGSRIVEVSEPTRNAFAQFLRIAAGAKHPGIVIAFENQRVTTAQHGLDMPR